MKNLIKITLCLLVMHGFALATEQGPKDSATTDETERLKLEIIKRDKLLSQLIEVNKQIQHLRGKHTTDADKQRSSLADEERKIAKELGLQPRYIGPYSPLPDTLCPFGSVTGYEDY